MARRKSAFIEDATDSDSSQSSTTSSSFNDASRSQFASTEDQDAQAETALFLDPMARQRRGLKRSREQRKEDAWGGVLAGTEQEAYERATSRAGRAHNSDGNRWLKTAPSFVAAGSDPSNAKEPIDNLADTGPRKRLQAAQEDEEDLDMEMADSDDDEQQEPDHRDNHDNDDEDEDEDEDEEQDDYQDDDDDPTAAKPDQHNLAPVPGLEDTSIVPEELVIEQPTAALAFAPRIRPRTGIGGGARAGLGSGAAGRQPVASMIASQNTTSSTFSSPSTSAPTFAKATISGGRGESGSSSSSEPTTSAHRNGADSPMTGASPPRTELSASKAGIGRSGIGAQSSDPDPATKGREGSPGGALGFGARPSSKLVDELRSELASSGVESNSSVTNSKSYETTVPRPARERRSFLPTASTSTSTPSTQPAPRMSKKEATHFAALASSGSLGLKMLEKMGWKAGTGLGADGQGIVTPIGEGQTVRQGKSGITKGERSEGAKADERRRKGLLSDEEEEEGRGGRRGKGTGKGKRLGMGAKDLLLVEKENKKEAWTRPAGTKKRTKDKTAYKTYEELVAESGGDPVQQSGVGMLVDLSGNALPSTSLSSLPAFGAGSADPTRLPELRHNLMLLTTTLGSNLSALAREGKQVEERRKYLNVEEERVRGVVEKQELAIERVHGVLKLVARMKVIEQEVAEVAKIILIGGEGSEQVSPNDLFNFFIDVFDELLGDYEDEYAVLQLDEIVVAAIAPLCRKLFATWDPLTSPSYAVDQLKRWKKHFLIDKHEARDLEVKKGLGEAEVFGSTGMRSGDGKGLGGKGDRMMSAYETMLWTIWLPRVRTAINNHWSATNPTPVVQLYQAWFPLLPQFLIDNFLDQLVLPKVLQAIQEWTPTKRGSASKMAPPPLHQIVFPWLEVVGQQGRAEGVLDESKRRVRGWLKGWKSSDGVPKGLEAWKDVYPKSDWDSLMLKHILPHLGTLLRDQFIINPRAQELKPLEQVLGWSMLLRSSMMSQLLEKEWVPKWLDALFIWLTTEGCNYEQVAEWYSWWKSYLPEEVVALSGVSKGLRKGLDLMNQAMALGEDAKYRLKRPDLLPPPTSSSHSTKSSSKPKPAPSRHAEEADDTITFRSIVEEIAASHNLIFLSTGTSDEKGRTLYRVSETVDGKKGLVVYLEEDVVWFLDKGEWRPIGVDDMCRKALGV
ncbi:BZ3500_MvSof-1268-A1-R1_Chr3-1g05734 [Microbotryum saponariae]|uniref:BZ3500_MvSof-1268-A1-R1_Chr3-1g05734 protein n=1 Tax=Microbotryum saponariae TaxID=289078 RepID=A0A2X0MWP7_9BASI|nr:BZ3500_MvSof-1268-A1-R1_Chr3-1g05734 [Microbotryum saponariae]SDA04924.1 BZ3501_MvSof-1269-A2-R1_Chr3-1g05404 [Microbotryum saponariae]